MNWQPKARALMRERSCTQDDIAKHLHVTRGTIGHWLTGRRTPSPEELQAVANFLGTTLADLIGEPPSQGAISAYDPSDPLPDDLVQIKVSNVRFSGGNGATAVHCEIDETSEPHTYQRSWFVRERLRPERCIRYRVRNSSMEPMLFPNDWILVNLDERVIVDGGVYAFRYGDELRVKKLQRRLNGGLVLHSINPEYRPEEVSPSDVDQHITIIGRVRDKGGRGGL